VDIDHRLSQTAHFERHPMLKPTTSLSFGRAFIGLATMASGILQLVVGDFVRLVPKLPAWVPAPSAWATLVGVSLVAIGSAILSGRGARAAASLLAVMILFTVVFLYAPQMVWNPVVDHPFFRGFMWTNPLKSLALAGGLASLAGRLPGSDRPLPALVGWIGRRAPLAPLFLALFLAVCGIQHFVYRGFVDTLVPAWIPPTQRFWTYLAGVALVAGGVGILIPKTSRLAASLSALMIFLWVLLLHIPRALMEANHANETAGVFEALALSGVALLVASAQASRPEGRN
jgi:uncharacterized membrane protein YphA (DoxX/SURF4 family)